MRAHTDTRAHTGTRARRDTRTHRRAQARLDKPGWWENVVKCWEREQSTTEKMLASDAGAVRPRLAAPVPRSSEPRFPIAAPNACKHARTCRLKEEPRGGRCAQVFFD